MKPLLKGKKASILLILIMVCVLQGCGMNKTGAGEYVQASLDAGYKGEADDYVRITNSTKEEAEQLYEANIDIAAAGMGLAGTDGKITKEERLQYKELIKKVLRKEKYTIGKVKETKDGYKVPVVTEPLLLSDNLEEETAERMQEKVKGMGEIPGEDEIQQLARETLCEVLEEKVREPVYGEKSTVDVRVIKNQEGMWEISEEDLQKIDFGY